MGKARFTAGLSRSGLSLMAKFSHQTIEKHLRRKHPTCPDFAVAFFVAEIGKKDWKGASIGKAVGITMQSVLRHSMTDYDQLLLAGVDREEAPATGAAENQRHDC
ncbi:DUF2293 domain-containing protein [Rhizobium sp. NZLR1]|uniref:DUF2293 domain-containing protein n=1 Tax=Rhizobium sp. NZLR1 TaxID=2731096 RepID=UPI001FEDA320|nr:DUF2293 domain-containing protein [Rhizobium sp. NZLR1]